MSHLIKTLHSEFQTRLANLEGQQLVPRDVVLPHVSGRATVAMGMRRSGKTYLLLMEIKRLLAEGVPVERILYIDFEDDRLLPMTQSSLSQLIDDFYALYPENHEVETYLCLDEIQVIPGWSLVIRRLLNTKNIKIYLTRSSAKLLSKELATEMRGRAIGTEVWPFSIKENLMANNKIITSPPYDQPTHDTNLQHLETFLQTGGFPEVMGQPIFEKNRLLQDYIDVIAYRDIVDRYNISNINLIKYMIKYLVKNTATNFSINKFYNDLKSQGYAVSRDAISQYLQYLEDAYLTFLVPMFSESTRKVQVNPRKCYAIDTGMVNAYQITNLPNWGRLFENLIFLDLRRRGDQVNYYLTEKNRYKIDFISKKLDGTLKLYQVAWDISDPKTLHREQRALDEAMEELNLPGMLITKENYFTWFCDEILL